MSETLQILLGIVAIIGSVGGFLKWHFSAFNELKKEFHNLELKMKDLENRDNNQQQTLDELKELFPIFKEILTNKKNGDNEK